MIAVSPPAMLQAFKTVLVIFSALKGDQTGVQNPAGRRRLTDGGSLEPEPGKLLIEALPIQQCVYCPFCAVEVTRAPRAGLLPKLKLNSYQLSFMCLLSLLDVTFKFIGGVGNPDVTV